MFDVLDTKKILLPFDYCIKNKRTFDRKFYTIPMIKKILFIPIFLSCFILTAQDQDFTQFYGAPVALNPALTGAINGTFRFSTIYRDQWRNVLDNPIATFSSAADFRFNVLKANRSHDAAGIGMIFYNDKPGLTYSTNRLMLSGAFHKGLGKSGEQYLSIGFQAGIAQQNVGLSKLTFDDQFNGSTGYTEGTGEDFPENNFAFGDYNIGVNYSYTPEKRMSIYTGLAMSHILEPRISFYYDPKNPADFPDNHLYRKYTAYVNLSIPIGEFMKLSPRVLGYLQGPHFSAMAGSNIRFLVNQSNGTALHIGTWLRVSQPKDKQLGPESAIVLAGIEFNNYLFGFSYDANLVDFTGSKRGQGAFEFSIAYLGDYSSDDDGVICPKF